MKKELTYSKIIKGFVEWFNKNLELLEKLHSKSILNNFAKFPMTFEDFAVEIFFEL